jgi:inhibitor of cysteine peptidase
MTDALVLGAEADGQTLEIGPGAEVDVVLDENPTTGYRWEVLTDGAPAVTLVGDTFVAGGRVPGRGGRRSFRLRAGTAGSAVFRLALRRGWQTGAAPTRTFEVTFSVTRPAG